MANSISNSLKNGFMLVDVLAVIFVLSIITQVYFQFFAFQTNYLSYFQQIQIFHFLCQSRLTSLQFDTKTRISIINANELTEESELVQSTNSYKPNKLSISSTSGFLGFNSTGSTSYAGSVSIVSKQSTKKVSLGVGYGKITIK